MLLSPHGSWCPRCDSWQPDKAGTSPPLSSLLPPPLLLSSPLLLPLPDRGTKDKYEPLSRGWTFEPQHLAATPRLPSHLWIRVVPTHPPPPPSELVDCAHPSSETPGEDFFRYSDLIFTHWRSPPPEVSKRATESEPSFAKHQFKGGKASCSGPLHPAGDGPRPLWMI